MHRFIGALSIVVLSAAAGIARGEVLASSTFDVNPAPADPRLTHNGDGTLTASYNTLLETDKVLFPLSRPLTAADSFTVTTRFRILAANFSADPFGAAQISFGLANSITTGTDRSTTLTTLGDTFDVVCMDYFPNVSPSYASPTLSPTIFSSRVGTEAAIPGDLYSLFNPQSALNGPGESALPLDAWMTAVLDYSSSSRTLVLALTGDGGPLFINDGGGPDGATHTIELALPAGVNFNVDSYALMLWKDSWSGVEPSVRADVQFDSFSVTAVPEPASLALVAAGAALLLARRRRRH